LRLPGLKLLGILLLLTLTGCSLKPADPGRYLRLNTADFQFNDQRRPPDEKTNWQPLKLPDLWDFTHPDRSGAGWYRFRIRLNVAPNRLWGIYLPRINRSVAVFMNDILLGSDVPLKVKNTTSWNYPIYLPIPNGLLRAGENILYLRLTAEANLRGRLLPVYLGPDEYLRQFQTTNYFLRITMSQLVGAFALTMGLCMSLLWYIRRESEYGWFALGSLFWAIFTSWFFLQNIPLPLKYWIAFTHGSGILMIGSMWCFVGTFADLQIKNTKRILIGYCILATIILFLTPENRIFDTLVIAYFLLQIPAGWLLYLFVKYWQAHPSVDTTMIFISVLPIVLLGGHDWLNLAFHLQRSYLMHYTAPFIFILIGWSLIHRFSTAIDAADRLNAELEVRVMQREQELTQAMSTIHTLEKKKMIEEERERIMRDIHDGVGGQLVSALAMMENSGQVSKILTDTLTYALDDLRLIIDSLAPEEEGLPAMLAMFKYRYEPKLKQQGIAMHWQQDEVSVLASFSPRHSLQLLRIIQEAFTNILKHAHADQIEVGITAANNDQKQASIYICDNGIGFPTDQKSVGRGLLNMKRRAKNIGCDIEFYNQGQGACVRLWLPDESSYLSNWG